MAQEVVFSIIVPSFNRLQALQACVQSLQAQSIPKSLYEIIIVDDGSTDGTFEAMAKLDHIQVARLSTRSGPSVARNFGASKAKGRYLVFTDSDCVVPSDWLAKIGEGYEKNAVAGVAGVGGSIYNDTASTFADLENHIYASYQHSPEPYISAFIHELPFALGNMSYKKAVFDEVGGLNTNIPYYCAGEDADLKKKVLARGYTLAFLPVVVLHKHNLDLTGFYNQSLIRGASMLLDSKQQGHMQTKPAIFLRLFVFKLYFFKTLLKLKSFSLAWKETAFYIFRNLGKLKYYNKIANLKL